MNYNVFYDKNIHLFSERINFIITYFDKTREDSNVKTFNHSLIRSSFVD